MVTEEAGTGLEARTGRAGIGTSTARSEVGRLLPLLPPRHGAAAFDGRLLRVYGHIVSPHGESTAEIQRSSEAGAAEALPSSGSHQAHGSH